MFTFHSFSCSCQGFPAPHIEGVVFSPLYFLAIFVKDKAPVGAWVDPWALCLVPLVCISLLCQYHTVLMIVAL